MSKVAATHTPSRSRNTRQVGLAILGSVLLALPLAAQSATAQDLRSPDARDAGRRTAPAPAQDLRSPDARAAAQPVPQTSTQGADRGQEAQVASGPASGGSGDFSPVYLAVAGLTLLVMAGAATTRRRRRRVEESALAVGR